MKVLHVIARMNVGGTARYVGALVESIPGSALACGNVQGAEVEDPCVAGLPIVRIQSMGRKIAPLADIKAWWQLRGAIREAAPDIVHSHTFKAGLIARLVPGTFKRVHTFHGHLFDDQSFSNRQKRMIIFAEKFCASRTDVLVSVGKKVGIELRSAGIGVDQEWRSIAPGVSPLPVVRSTSSADKSPDHLVFGWMARVTSVKNPTLMVQVAKALPEISFIMAGGGDMLEEIRASAPINLSVIGWTDATEFWSQIDVAISTSDNEGMPIALIEAQLAGIPVIATDVGSNAEVIEDGVTGLVTAKNLESLVAAVQKLRSDPTMRASMEVAARGRSREEFGMDRMIEAHQKLYSDVRRTLN
jgi:glycosyltransferase involved in cell wall biosynthesis